MSDDSAEDAYAEGADAALAGAPEDANPYDPEDESHLWWNDGWASIHDEAGPGVFT